MAPFYSSMNVFLKTVRHCAIAMVLFTSCLVVVMETALGDPSAQLVPDSVDFGKVKQGETVTAKFRVHNVGTESLSILGLEFSMPGMNARVKQEIDAGTNTDILMTWDTSRLRGEVEGQTVLTLNDPQNPKIVLTLSGTVVPSIEILPRPAVYISQFSGETKFKSLRIRNNQQSQLNIVRLEPLGDHFQANYEVLEQGSLFEITVSIPAETPIGRYRESLIVHTDDPAYKSFHLEVNLLVKADIFINPEIVDFGRVSLARIRSNPEAIDFLTQTLVINRREGEMSIISANTDLPFIAVQQDPEGRSEAFRLDVGLNADKLVKGPFEGYIMLSTDDSDFSDIKIPVKGEVSD
jgi:hypothetical protein